MTGGTEPALVVVSRHEVVALCMAALDDARADRRVAELLTDAALFAEDRGKAVVGVAHLLDHVDAMHDRRLDGHAVPRISHPSPAVTTSDARGGIAHAGLDRAFPHLVRAARRYGLAAFAQHASFTCGPLLVHRPPRRDRTRRVRHRGRPGRARRRTGHRAGLRHQPHGLLGPPPRTRAAHRRPGLEQHGVRVGPGRRGAGRAPARRLGRGRARRSDDAESLALRADVLAALRRRAGHVMGGVE